MVDSDENDVYFLPGKGKGATGAARGEDPREAEVEVRRARYRALRVPVLREMLRERGRPQPQSIRKDGLICVLVDTDAAWGQRCSLGAQGGSSGDAAREAA